ncbi:MAG: hypothetical protein CMJ81_03405 [Planctomycetaceae bacterium]|nr:hypothetical protein [Planctomycetaceae bacterium]MBP60121.1 hypothetical protein [Planctomycetaceae bacterium]
MIACPSCGHENIEGTDECEQCQQPIGDAYLPPPTSSVEEGLLTERVAVLNPKVPITVEVSDTVQQVLDILVNKGIGCVVVVDQGRPVGIFSEHDALMRLNTDTPASKDRPVVDFMTPNPRMLDNEAKVAFATQRMDLDGYRHIPITDRDGALQGIVSVRDILRYLTDKLASEQQAS